MQNALPAEFAEFLQFNLALHLLFVLAGIVIYPLTNGASQADKIFGKFRFSHTL
jgi:hypothetical protein